MFQPTRPWVWLTRGEALFVVEHCPALRTRHQRRLVFTSTSPRTGVFIGFGSDNLPIDPRVGLYAAVTRKGLTGKRVYGPQEALSIGEAIRMYTYNPTFLSWDEHKKGSLEPGKFADFIVLDSDPLTISPEKLLTLKVLQTFIGGKKVYSAGH